MRRIAAVLMMVAFASQSTSGQGLSSSSTEYQVAACQTWGDQLRATVRRLHDHGLLPSDDTSAVNGLIEIMGQRCSGGDATRISTLYAILLDTLVDQRNQP